MDYKIDLGGWNSVFAVPGELVDRHIKLAGAAQLKVILWFLRYAGREFSVSDISGALSMQEADVRDCLQYWAQTGLITISENIITPAPQEAEPKQAASGMSAAASLQTETAAARVSEIPVSEERPDAPYETTASEPSKKRALSRPEKPDTKYLVKRMSDDPSIAYLMQTADDIFGRITSNNDKATLLLIHEHDGLPVEVIIMLLQYAANIGKCNMRYIEKMAISWAEEEITSLALAEKKIDRLTSGRNCAMIVQRTIGLEEHSPTEKEMEFADLWINQWKFTADMIREAYERCVDAKGKYIPKYTSSVLERWYHAGITTVEQARNEKLQNRKSKPTGGSGGAYDIDLFESTSVIDEEW